MLFSKKRIPEPEEDMSGKKEVNSFIGNLKGRTRKGNINQIVCRDIFKNIKINSGEILDVGSGYGGLIKEIEKHKPKKFSFVGIDLSEGMNKFAEKFCKGISAKFFKRSASKTNFKDGRFDLVVCKDTFHHFYNPIKSLKEMYRVTKKGGYIYVLDVKRNPPGEVIYSTIQRIIEDGKNVIHPTQYIHSVKAGYLIPEIKALLKNCNIKNYKVWYTKPGKDFVSYYGVDPKKYLPSEHFFLGRWVLIIKKD
ncbi:MAG: class I SAM-dependent methyltransferase [Nanoarchaeota archaeon]